MSRLLEDKHNQREQDRLYRLAKKKGFMLQKCPTRDIRSQDYGTYRLITRDPQLMFMFRSSSGYGLTLREIDRYLATAPSIAS